MAIHWHLFLNIFAIVLICQLKSTHSIQCCSDSACSEKFIECPNNVCFKLDMQILGSEKHREERGCMNDLMNLVIPKKANGSNLMDDNGDSCQKMDGPSGGIILCKCTSNLCNISSKNSHSYYPVNICIFFVILYQYFSVFRR